MSENNVFMTLSYKSECEMKSSLRVGVCVKKWEMNQKGSQRFMLWVK